jgi:transcriptional regulator with XRE-family HTH domain
MSDKAIIELIGEFIKHNRLQQNITQAQLATMAGVNRWTLTQIENSEAITLLSLIQILRALNQLHLFDIFRVEQEISPIALAKLEQKKRKRARIKNTKLNNKTKSDW